MKAHYQLAAVLESEGRHEEAMKLYEEFLGYWDKADVALPEIQRARDALNR